MSYQFIWSHSLRLFILVTLGFGPTACSTFDALDEMKNTTQGMAHTTESMDRSTADMADQVKHTADTTDHVSAKTDQVLDATLNMMIDLRPGNAWTIRNEAFKNLEHYFQMPAKLAEAAAFFEAMEDQLWKDEFFDDAQNLESLQTAAVDQFLRKSEEFITSLNKQAFHKEYDLDPFSHDNRMKNLYALATTMHLINPNAERLFDRHHLPKLSMLNLLENSLASKKEFNQKGKNAFPTYVNEVLFYETASRYLIRLRANFLAAMALGKMSGLEDKNDIVQNITGLRNLLFAWTLDLSKKNLAEILVYNKWLTESVNTCHWLHLHKLKCQIDGQLQSIYQHMTIKLQRSKHLSPLFVQAVIDLKASIKQFLAGSS